MGQSYLKNAALLTGADVLLRLAGMGLRIYLANALGGEGMGLYQLVLAVYALFVTLATAGVSVAATRLMAEELARGRAQARGMLVRLAGTGLLLGTAAMAAQYGLAGAAARWWLGDVRAAGALRVSAFGMPWMALSAVLRGFFIARRRVEPNVLSQLVEQSANKYLRHFVFYGCGRAVALLLGNPSDFEEYLHILADEICQLADRALGRSASVGVSREFARFSDLNDAYKQAIEALRAAAEGEGGVSFTADVRKTGSLCERALEIIEQHYMDEDLSLASLSAMLDVSPNHLSACIKKSEGETFINILVRRRMETAQTLLLTTDLQIQEIARRCGYTDQHYFSYCFKKYSGTSPVALRRARAAGEARP